MATEESEVFARLSRLEQEMHTLKYRAEEISSHNLPIRVTNLESTVKNIGADVAKIETSVDEMKSVGIEVKEDVATIKAWGKGVSITLTALVAVIGLVSVIPVIEGLLK